jgi:hypothetical protein
MKTVSKEQSLERRKLTLAESVGIGTVTGVATVSAYLPLWTIKTRMQGDMPFTLNPRILYKGYGLALVTMVPMKMIQIFTSSRVENATSDANANTVSSKQRIYSAFAGGICSSMVTNMLNLVTTQQHKQKQKSPRATAQMIKKQLGFRAFFVGYPTIAVAEGLYTSAYYGFFPPLKQFVNSYVHNEPVAAIAAGVLAGASTAVITQPLDRIKTTQHLRVDEQDARGVTQCIRSLYKDHGIRVGFFKGLLPRTMSLVAAVVVAGSAADITESAYRKHFV